MKLGARGRYAVMAMADLARRTAELPDGGSITLCEIAERQEISLFYLEQLFAKLRRGGLVTAARGPKGGYRLAHTAEETRIADIMYAVEEPTKVTRCRTGSPKGCLSHSARCLTHDLWEELGRQIDVFLESVTLADVVEHRVLGRAHLTAPAPLLKTLSACA